MKKTKILFSMILMVSSFSQGQASWCCGCGEEEGMDYHPTVVSTSTGPKTTDLRNFELLMFKYPLVRDRKKQDSLGIARSIRLSKYFARGKKYLNSDGKLNLDYIRRLKLSADQMDEMEKRDAAAGNVLQIFGTSATIAEFNSPKTIESHLGHFNYVFKNPVLVTNRTPEGLIDFTLTYPVEAKGQLLSFNALTLTGSFLPELRDDSSPDLDS